MQMPRRDLFMSALATPLSLLVLLLTSPLYAASPTAAAAAAIPQVHPAVPAQSRPFNPRDLTGVWMQVRGRVFKSYPFTPKYAAILKQREAAAAAGNPFQVAQGDCLPAGLAASMTTGAYPIEIYYQYGGREILFDKENVGALYRVYLNRPHLSADELYPMFYGDSVGRWDGNVLIVDTISLGATSALDLMAPHSDALHVIQKFHRVSYDTLDDRITFDDPKALTRPVTGTVVFKYHPDWELKEYECTNERLDFTGGTQKIKASTVKR